MEQMHDILCRNGHINDGTTPQDYDLFKLFALFRSAAFNNDEETMKALIFVDSPILLAEINNIFGFPLLHTLIMRSPNIAIVQLLIDFGINIDKQNAEGDTALHVCVRNCVRAVDKKNEQLNLLKFLLKRGANRELRDEDGFTPVQRSLFYGNLEVAEEFLQDEDKLLNVIEVDRNERCRHLVKCFLQKSNDWNIPGKNYSVLSHFLIFQNAEETLEYVVNNTTFDVNAANHEEYTLLHFAARHGTPRIIRALINAGADPDAVCHLVSPLIVAMKKHRTEAFHCLLDCGASVTKICETEKTSALHYAVCLQSLEFVERLVKLGADVNALTFSHHSPLLLACGSIYSKQWRRDSDFGLISVCYSDSRVFILDDIQEYPFNIKIVEFLLDHGADIEAKNASNRTSLDQSCKFGRLDIVKLLLSRGAKLDQGNVSTLHHAVRGENPAVIKLILEQGVNVNYRCAPDKMLGCANPPPRTPLECALDFIHQDSNCMDIIELLVEYGVNINVSDPVRNGTPLHLACLSNKMDDFLIRESTSRPGTIKLLLRHNANINALDGNGLTPLHYALRNYILTNGDYTTGNSSSRFKPDLETLIAFIAIMIEKKEYVIEKNLLLLQDESARSIYQECVNEFSLMKKNICESRNFSFFNILFKNIECVSSVLKKEEVFQVLNNGNYKEDFPIYGEYLQDRILEASIRQRLVDLAIFLFQKHINKNISVEPMLKIFKFLNLDDFKNFANSCFVDIEGK